MTNAKAARCIPLSVAAGRPSSLASLRKRASHAKLRSTTQRRGGSTKPRLASDHFTTDNSIFCFAVAAAGFSPVYP